MRDFHSASNVIISIERASAALPSQLLSTVISCLVEMEAKWLLLAACALAWAVEAKDVGVRRPSVASALNDTFSIISNINKIKMPQTVAGGKCDINLKKDLPRNQPLFIKSDGQFMMPDNKGIVHLTPGEGLRLICPGRDNKLSKLGEPEAAVNCAGGANMSVSPQKKLTLKELDCTSLVQHSAKKSSKEKCEIPGNYQLIDVGYDLPDGSFISIMKTCFDDQNKDAIYTKFLMSPGIAGAQIGEQRPSFIEGPFYPDLKVNSKYVKEGQKVTFAQILGSDDLANQFIGDGDYYLARGHLAARADFVYSSHQRATFWYVNVAPQWQTFNGGNWNNLEDSVRKFAGRNGQDLLIYTGTHGLATLPDANGREQPLYLSIDQGSAKIKVPEVFWKVVYEISSGKAVAFVGVNNPYKSTFQKLCNDVCDQLDWLSWQPNNQKLGFSYCCEVNALKKAIPTIPNLKVSGLLE